MNIEKLIHEGAPVVDVRTPGEFSMGSVPNSKNIPLNEVPQRIEEFKAMNQPLVLCCASGNRSGQAAAFLSQQGVECYNGGGWMDVNYVLSQKSA